MKNRVKESKAYYKKNKEKIKKYSKAYYREHREECKKYQKEYNQKHKEKIRKRDRVYRRNHQKLITQRQREWTHKKGICKKYYSMLGISYTPEYRKMTKANRRRRFKNAGELTIKTIQLVYEDNIKKYGTITCEYCKNPIEFGKDHLEHKIPLSRGGTNNYDNLCIACEHCNRMKYTKTVEEFLKCQDGKNF